MSLLSLFQNNKQEAADEGEFRSRAEDDTKATRTRSRRKAGDGNEPADPVLPEKKRARRRLIGAVALVLAAVIGLPMFLDAEPQPPAEEIDIQIPSKEKSSPINMEKRASSAVAPRAALDQAEQIVEPVPAQAEKAAAPAVATDKAAKPAEKPSVAVKPNEISAGTKSDAARITTSDTKTATKTATDPSVKAKLPETNQLKTTDTKPDGKTAIGAASDSANKQAKFMVQVAALSSPEKINELRSKLTKAGIQSQTQKVATESGERTRIRVGPFASKEEAEKMRTRLAKLGLTGTLVPSK